MSEQPVEPNALGKIAYEAYAGFTGWKSAVTGTPLPTWEAQRVVIQAAWECAGMAVAQAIIDESARQYLAAQRRVAKPFIAPPQEP